MTPRIHEAAGVGFDRSADAYERGRPSYPQAAIDHIVASGEITGDSLVVDLAAGTGKFTRLLLPTGARIIAVEPVPGMRKEFARHLPDVEVIDGTAEKMPLENGLADAVTVAQAFHWFDPERALAEIHRVLRERGWMFLIWNRRDEERSRFWADLTEVLLGYQGDSPTHRTRAWQPSVETSELFGPLDVATFGYEHEQSRADVLDRVLSISYIAALPETGRERVREQVLSLLDGDPATAGRETVSLPYLTDVWSTRAS